MPHQLGVAKCSCKMGVPPIVDVLLPRVNLVTVKHTLLRSHQGSDYEDAMQSCPQCYIRLSKSSYYKHMSRELPLESVSNS